MGIAHDVIEKFSTVLDVMAAKASRSSGTSVMAECVEVDENGVPWVRILGSESATPATTRLATAQKGDLVTMNIRAGKAVLNGNLTSPSCTQREYESLKQVTVTEIANIKEAMVDRAVVKELIAGSAVIRELYADVADIEEVIADVMTAEYADLHYAQIDFANVNSADVGTAKIVELLANSGIFQNLTYNDGVVTGTLTAVEILGDLIRANTVLADKIVYPGSDGMYYMLNYHGGYYEAEPEEGDDPSEEGWYELGQDNSYRLSSDTSVSAGKTYYVLDESKALQMEQAKYAHALDGSRIVAKSVTANEISTESLTADAAFVSSLRTLMLLTEAVQIGATGKVHIEMSNNRFSFFEAGYSQPADMSGVSADTPLPGEVAYIAVDELGNSTFYMTRSVVVKDLRFGNWMWYGRDNGNLALKWMGGDI